MDIYMQFWLLCNAIFFLVVFYIILGDYPLEASESLFF